MTTQTLQGFAPKIFTAQSITFDVPTTADLKVKNKRVLNEDDLLGSGIQNIDVFGSAPNPAGASIPVPGHLQLQPADASHPGGLSTVDQTLPHGVKTFQDDVISKKRLRFDDATSPSIGLIEFGQTAKKARMFAHTQAVNGTKNLFWGENTGNFTADAQGCVGIGKSTLSGLSHGSNVVAIGENIQVPSGTDVLLAPGNAACLADEINKCVILGTGPTTDYDFVVGLREKETWLGRFNNTGGDITEKVRVAGVYNSSYEYGFDTLKPVICTPEHIVASYPYWPGTAAGPFGASVGIHNTPSPNGEILLLDVDPDPNNYVQRVGNTMVIQKSGIYAIESRFHCSPETTFNAAVRKNGVGITDSTCFTGKAIIGYQSTASFHWLRQLAQGDVIDIYLVGSTTSGSNWTVDGVGELSFTYFRHVE